MSMDASAALVRRADEMRFLSAMTARPEDRHALFVLYAFNVEIARAPWVSKEAMIAEMRLQFWRDVVDEAATGATRAHEVAEPLMQLIREKSLNTAQLDEMITARQWDIYRDPFQDAADFDRYINATSGHLIWAAAASLGAPAELEPPVRDFAYGAGIANWLLAVPKLEDAGRAPLLDRRATAVGELAERGLKRLRAARVAKGPWIAALRSGWMAELYLKQAINDPRLVHQGALGTSSFRRRFRLLQKTLRNSF